MNKKSQKTILLVEDEVLISMTEKMQLENYGYKVVTANTGEKAVDTFKDGHAIDLVLMDINLGSGIDGTEAAQLILNVRDVPIVFVSSHTEPEVVEKTEKITSYGYVVKSSSITVLDASIKMAFKLFDANRKITASESQYRKLVDGMPGIVYSFSSKRGGVFYSHSTKEIMGYAPEQLLANPMLWQNSIHPDDLPRLKDVIANSEKGTPFQINYRIQDTQGTWHWFDDRSFGARDEDGEVIIDGLAFDITSVMQAEEEIKARDIRLRKLFSNIPDLVFQFTRRPDGSYHVPIASQGISNIFGCSPEDVLEDFEPIGRVIHPEDAARVIADIEYSAEHLSYFTCEFRVILPGKGEQWIYSRSSPERLSDGSVTWHGFNANITDKKLKEQETARASAVLKATIESPKDLVIMAIDRDYRYLHFNSAHREAMRVAYGTVPAIGASALECINSPDDRVKAKVNYDRAMRGESHSTLEEYGDLEKAFFESHYDPILGGQGEVIGITAFARDITERKRIERQLQLAYENLAAAQRIAHLGSHEHDILRNRLYWSDEVFAIMGMDRGDFIGSADEFFNRIHPDDRDVVRETIENAHRERTGATFEHRIVRPDGSIRFVEEQFRMQFNDRGEHVFNVGTIPDITERKQSEIALKESEVFLRAVFETARDGFWIIDETGQIKDVSETFCQLIGYKREELLSMSIFDIEAFENPEATKTHIEHIQKMGFDIFESKHRHKNGKLIDVEVSVTWLGEELRRFVSICRDISVRKTNESRVRESEEKYRVLFNNEIYAICIFDLETLKFLDVNEAYERLYGYSQEELVSGMTIHDITAERQASNTATVQAKQEGTMHIPLRYHRKKDGTVFPVEIVGGPYEWKGRKVMFALAHDISDRKKAEDTLHDALVRQQAIIEGTNAGTWEWNVQTGETIFNERWAEMVGYTLAELSPITIHTWESLIHPDDASGSESLLNRHFSGELPYYDYECRMRHKDGRWIWVHDRGRLMTRSDDGTPLMMFGTHSDINHRKSAEDYLKKEEYNTKQLLQFTEEMLPSGSVNVLYQKILENLLLLTGAKYGVMTLLDGKTEKYTTVAVAGFKEHIRKITEMLGIELVGKVWPEYSTANDKLEGKSVSHFASLSELVGSVLPHVVTKAIEKLLDMGEVAVTKVVVSNTVIGDFTLIMPSGKHFEADTLVEIYSKQVNVFITRVKAEEDIKRLNDANLELLRELQHRAKNSFNMISSMVGMASSDAVSCETKNALAYLGARISSVSELYSLLYSAGSFDNLKLDDYCACIASPLIALAGNISLKTELESVHVPVRSAAPIGLILTELVTNTVKYAFPAGRKGTVTVRLKKIANSKAILEVVDDGVGVPGGFDIANHAGIGLNLVQGLAAQIGGIFRMETDAVGTRCTLEFDTDPK